MATNKCQMFSLILCIVVTSFINWINCNDNLHVAYEWKQIDYDWPTPEIKQEAIDSMTFIQQNVIPVGLEVYKSRLFITLPRWKKGVPASLAYININDNSTKSPVLKPYPSWSAHRYSGEDVPEIISPFRIRADRCGRLWVLDTGVDDILNDTKSLAPPQLLIYDLQNDNLLRRFSIPQDQHTNNSFFANIVVEDHDCDNTFAYAADLGSPGLVVYSWNQQESWRVKHNYFHPDPLAGNFSVAGVNFQWDDGIFGVALSKKQSDGYSQLYFHPFSSTQEFSVSTSILQNSTLAQSDEIYKEFKVLGTRGPNGQSGAAFLDQLTGVLFYAMPNLNAITCWKTSNRDYNYKSIGRVYMSPVEMVFPNDVKVDDEDRLWVLSDRLQQFMYHELNTDEINFRILKAHVKDAIENTACDTTPKPLPDIINKLGDILRPSTTMQPKKSSGITNTPAISTILVTLGSMYFMY